MKNALMIFICLLAHAICLPKMDSIGVQEFSSAEREALIELRESVNSTLNLHSIWTGPPCLDNSSNWVGIACFNSHVIHIVLEGIQMTGSLPSTFLQNITYLSKLSFGNNALSGPLPNLSNLSYLRFLNLSQNSFSGSIPMEYVKLGNLVEAELEENHLTGKIPPFNQQSLRVFNVSHNQLEGPIPQTAALRSFPSSSYDQNSELCGKPLRKPCPAYPSPPTAAPSSPTPHPSHESPSKGRTLKTWTIMLIAAVATLVPFSLMLIFLCRRHSKAGGKEAKGKDSVLPGEIPREWTHKNMPSSSRYGDPGRRVELEFLDGESPAFDLDDLLRSPAELMGKGNLGSTYKATLESGSVVTVKRLKDMNRLSKKEFVQQMQLLGKMKHENLVQVFSFYFSKEEKLVVYEYIPDGSLFELLHGNRGSARIPLDWATRLSIIQGVAKGLAYLHQSSPPSHKVPHGNLKSPNVLVLNHRDRGCQTKLTDFGFLPLLPSRKPMEKLAMAMSPELSQGKKLTHKVDVYCFGILLLEVVTGRIPGEFSPAVDEHRTDDLSEWVREVVKQDWSTDILDLEIVGAKEGHAQMLQLTEIGLQCTSTAPEQRPKMGEVVRKIEEISQECRNPRTRTCT